jgi:hypothetical protein
MAARFLATSTPAQWSEGGRQLIVADGVRLVISTTSQLPSSARMANTIIEEEQRSAAASALLLHKHAVIEVASAWNNQRVVRRHALQPLQREQ